mgnify:CR=1 FL=1
MGAWLLKITGVIALSALSSLLIPNGQTKKYVKGIFALITLFVLVSPLPKLLKSDFSGFPNAFDTAAELEIDETFLSLIKPPQVFLRPTPFRQSPSPRFLLKSETSSEIDYVNVILSDKSFERDKSNSIDIGALKSEISKFSGVPEDKLRVFYER